MIKKSKNHFSLLTQENLEEYFNYKKNVFHVEKCFVHLFIKLFGQRVKSDTSFEITNQKFTYS